MNESEKYDIRARAFLNMTGHIAPGKDASVAQGGNTKERQRAWQEWLEKYEACVDAVIDAYIEVY